MSSAPSVLVLDGAAGTYLESLGVQPHPKLWSSGALINPEGYESIRKLHQAYMNSNADVITSVTYQASIPGFMAAGISETESPKLITTGVILAREEADKFNRENNGHVKVAAGLGPYGAYLSSGEEYTGNYGKEFTEDVSKSFWIPRVRAALEGNPDALLFETVPNFEELRSIVTHAVPLANKKKIPVWISLSLKISGNDSSKEVKLADGTSINHIKDLIDQNPNAVDLIGANCFDIAAVPLVISELSKVGLPLIIYPNSGEVYDGVSKTWASMSPEGREWNPREWASQGAKVIGGCCRTNPKTIKDICNALN